MFVLNHSMRRQSATAWWQFYLSCSARGPFSKVWLKVAFKAAAFMIRAALRLLRESFALPLLSLSSVALCAVDLYILLVLAQLCVQLDSRGRHPFGHFLRQPMCVLCHMKFQVRGVLCCWRVGFVACQIFSSLKESDPEC